MVVQTARLCGYRGVSTSCAPSATKLGFILAARCVSFIAFVLLSPVAGLAATGSPLTLAAAQQLALARSAQIQAAALAVTASVEMVKAADELPDPEVRFSLENFPVEGADRYSFDRDFMTMRQVGLMQEFTRPRKRRLRAEKSEQAVRVAGAEHLQTVVTVQRETAVAWMNRYYAEAFERTVARQVEASNNEVIAAEVAYRQGRGSLADLLSSRGAVEALEDQRAEAARLARAANISLARWIGSAADQRLVGQPRIDTIPFHLHDVEGRLLDHPEVQVLTQLETLAQTEVQLARAERAPDFTFELMYGLRGNAYSDMVSLSVSMPLTVNRADRQDRVLAAKLAEAARTRAQREDLIREHAAEISKLVDEWTALRDRRQRYVERILPLAADRVETAAAAYRGGNMTLAELLAARQGELEVQLRALELEAAQGRIWAELNFILPITEPALMGNSRNGGVQP